jgi:superfamily II DNA or RNA helicase
LHHWFKTKPTSDHALIALPTAAGKTIIFSHFIKEVLAKEPERIYLWQSQRSFL